MSKKGPQFERDFARELSLWWSKGKSNQIFWRTSQSGGRMTTLAKQGLAGKFHHGDIGAIDPSGQALIDFCTFEVKRGYPRETIQDLIDCSSGKTKYFEWINQAKKQCELSQSQGWLLIVKRDRRDPIVIMPLYIAGIIDLDMDATIGDLGVIRLKAFFQLDPDVIKVAEAERLIT